MTGVNCHRFSAEVWTAKLPPSAWLAECEHSPLLLPVQRQPPQHLGHLSSSVCQAAQNHFEDVRREAGERRDAVPGPGHRCGLASPALRGPVWAAAATLL
jgi:hypothetical protein